MSELVIPPWLSADLPPLAQIKAEHQQLTAGQCIEVYWFNLKVWRTAKIVGTWTSADEYAVQGFFTSPECFGLGEIWNLLDRKLCVYHRLRLPGQSNLAVAGDAKPTISISRPATGAKSNEDPSTIAKVADQDPSTSGIPAVIETAATEPTSQPSSSTGQTLTSPSSVGDSQTVATAGNKPPLTAAAPAVLSQIDATPSGEAFVWVVSPLDGKTTAEPTTTRAGSTTIPGESPLLLSQPHFNNENHAAITPCTAPIETAQINGETAVPTKAEANASASASELGATSADVKSLDRSVTAPGTIVASPETISAQSAAAQAIITPVTGASAAPPSEIADKKPTSGWFSFLPFW